MRPFFLVLAVAVVVALGGCGGEGDEAKDVAGRAADTAVAGADAATPDPAAKAVAAEPATVPVALPAWFPKDVFLPADHVIAEVHEEEGAHAVDLRTPGEVLGLAPQAQAAMLGAGWTENHYSPVDTRGGASMYYRKGDRSATLAMAWSAPGEVRVLYNFATVQKPETAAGTAAGAVDPPGT